MWFPEPGAASVALLHVYPDRRLLRRVPLHPLDHILQPVIITNRDFLEQFVTLKPYLLHSSMLCYNALNIRDLEVTIFFN
jgi:hypothetical protein